MQKCRLGGKSRRCAAWIYDPKDLCQCVANVSELHEMPPSPQPIPAPPATPARGDGSGLTGDPLSISGWRKPHRSARSQPSCVRRSTVDRTAYRDSEYRASIESHVCGLFAREIHSCLANVFDWTTCVILLRCHSCFRMFIPRIYRTTASLLADTWCQKESRFMQTATHFPPPLRVSLPDVSNSFPFIWLRSTCNELAVDTWEVTISRVQWW